MSTRTLYARMYVVALPVLFMSMLSFTTDHSVARIEEEDEVDLETL